MVTFVFSLSEESEWIIVLFSPTGSARFWIVKAETVANAARILVRYRSI